MRTRAKKAGLVFGVLAAIALATYAVYAAGGSIEVNFESLTLLLLATSFMFPLMHKTLSNNKRDPGELYLVAISVSIGFALVFVTLGLAFNWDSITEAAVVLPFIAIGFSLIGMALFSITRLVRRPYGRRPKRG